MGKAIADYRWCGGPLIEYDPDAPCIICEKPVGTASMGGTIVCPSCDCGCHRDGRKWTLEEATILIKNARKRGWQGI